ncbi:MAG: beta-ketoacyl-[acyl-carrier-protein] synthase II [Planctomycetes bacterium]|nr:beta-ketoacyl-[acyl-carrier-protein] synthase II [Planctomycetota bacterium]
MADSNRRVVITGMGALTPVGVGAPLLFDSLVKGKTGFRNIERWDTTEYATKFAAEVRGCVYQPDDHYTTREQKRMDPFAQVGLVAAREAWADSGLDKDVIDSTRSGAILGTGIGGVQSVLDQKDVLDKGGPRRVTPFFISNTMANSLSANVAIEFGLQGACFLTSSACASSGHAIGMAFREIRTGRADVMVTGGSETTTNALCLAGFNSLKALSTRNDDIQRSSRPFDRDRDGFVMGEGAGVLVIESLEHAQARGAKIYAEIAGFGQTDDAGHITAPDSTAQRPAAALKAAMNDAGINDDEVDYINAHGTSTMMNDMIETLAIKIALSEENAKKVAISSSKSMVGHLVGAAAAVEGIACAYTLAKGVAHPTKNLDNPDVENGCDLDYIPNEPREGDFKTALSTSLGFGGHNVCIAFRKFEG